MMSFMVRHIPESLDQNMQVFHRVMLQLEYIVKLAEILQLFNDAQGD